MPRALKNMFCLFQSVSRDVTADQANVVIFPLEISRIISVLIHGSDHDSRKENALREVLLALTNRILNGFLILHTFFVKLGGMLHF